MFLMCGFAGDVGLAFQQRHSCCFCCCSVVVCLQNGTDGLNMAFGGI